MRYALLSDLVTRTRARVGYENNTHVTDAELQEELKSAGRALLDVLLEIHGPEPYRTLETVQLVPGVTLYDLSTRVKEVLAVYACRGTLVDTDDGPVVITGKPYADLRAFEEWERVGLLNADYTDHTCLRWRLGGREANDSLTTDDVDQLELLPAPSASAQGLISLSIVPYPIQAALDDTDTRILAPNNADEWLIARACAYIRVKEKDDPAPFYAIMQEVEGRVRAAHTRRTTHEPQRMRGRSTWKGGSPWLRDRGDYAEDWEP